MTKHPKALQSNLSKRWQTGFTLLELLMSMAIFLLIVAPIVGALITSQKTYRSAELRVSLERNMRAAFELLAQEISQAGLQPSGIDSDGLGVPLTTVVTGTCTGTPVTCISASPATDESVQVNSVSGIYPGEWLWVDAGPGLDCSVNGPCEQVVVDSVIQGPPATIKAKFQYNHLLQTINGTSYPTPLYGLGQYPQGIVPAGATPSGGSTSSRLELFGDLNGTGNSLLAVVYACPNSFPGPLTRTVYDATTGTQTSSTNLIGNVTACQFTYPNPLPTIPSGCGSMSGTAIITSVGISITVQSTMNDPNTKAPITVTKSFLNIQPRNVISALYVSCTEMANGLQQSPGNLP